MPVRKGLSAIAQPVSLAIGAHNAVPFAAGAFGGFVANHDWERHFLKRAGIKQIE